MDVEVLMKKGKNVTAAYIQAECCRSSFPETLKMLLDSLLDPLKEIDDWETIDWCKWLMAGGCTPDEFMSTVRKYDNAATCGLVWTANFVAYRCRTCGISPCMSLCAECFQRGNHKGHDFNMFRSQAGGACDCGDTNVMKEAGFCYLHGPHAHNPNLPSDPNQAPPDLLCVAHAMMPRLILRLIQYMREHCNSLDGFLKAVEKADKFITMLHDMSSLGAAMRQVMSHTLTNPQIYKNLTEVEEGTVSPEYYEFMVTSRRSYEEALTTLPNPEPPEEYKDIPSLQKNLIHRTFLEEFVFWTAKFEFPQKIVCLLLNLLPEADYKEAFTRAFVLHYGRISQLLVHCENPDNLSNRVVHVSVQLFSNEKLALKMTEEMGLLHVMVISLKYMMSKITVPSTLHDKANNFHRVVDCVNMVMKDHCYWPLVSDLNNILSHRPVALKFLEDEGLLKMWFSFLSLFQGMNVNHREMNQHIEFEPTTYYAAFSAELEASASPMWALVSHLRDESTAHLTKNLLRHCRAELTLWLESVNYEMLQNDDMQVSFHLPLHRYFAVFLYQAVKNQGLSLDELLPPATELKAMIQHPLRVQTAFYEINSGLWVRNGLQIKGQAMTYVQCHFCNSMVDADLFLLQVAMMNLPHGDFINSVIERFHLKESFSISSGVINSYLEPDQELLMMENCFIFLSTLASVRTSIGMNDSDLVTLEMISLLCMADKTHSQLMELMPERCGNSSQSRDFESVLARVADYKAPNFESSGNMLQGMYVPKAYVWDRVYDPIYILLRAVHRRDFQTSVDRFTDYAKQSGKFRGSGSPWPPFRVPIPSSAPYVDPRHMLLTKVLHGLIFVIFHKAVNTTVVSDQLVALSVYLLEMALTVSEAIGPQVITPIQEYYGRIDMDFSTWFTTDSLFSNLRAEVDSVLVKPSPLNNSDSSDEISVDEMEVESYDDEVEMFESFGTVATVGHSQQPQSSHRSPRPLALMPPNTIADSEMERQLLEEVTAEMSRRRREQNLQIVLAQTKPVISVNRRDVERSSSIGGNSTAVEVVLNESIISLLLQLHSKFSGVPDSYVPFWETSEGVRLLTEAKSGLHEDLHLNSTDSKISYSKLYQKLHPVQEEQRRIGDGPYFIGQLLDKICAADESCREHLVHTKEILWPRKLDNEEEIRLREERDRQERRRIAEERQKKLMADMKRQQDKFIKKVMKEEFGEDEKSGGSDREGVKQEDDTEESESSNSDSIPGSAAIIKPIEYDCVICNQTSPSTATNPMGLIIILQASSVLGHRRRKGGSPYSLPTSEDERLQLSMEDTMTLHNEKRLEKLKMEFDDESWLMAISAGWEGGVHAHTCGHHLHHDCLKDYLAVLKGQQRQHNISIDRGEYSCPLCRQLANSFLPLSPEFGIRQAALVKDRKSRNEAVTPEKTDPEIPPSPEANVAIEVVNLLREYPFPTVHCKIVDAMAKTMEEMTNATSLKYRKVGSSKNTKSILLFVNSIARTNLELEVVLRGGSLVCVPDPPQPSTSATPPATSKAVSSRRSCIVPLLHVLGVHYKILSTDPCSPKIWERILGVRFSPDTSLMTLDREVPMLLRDPCTILLHLLMQLPMHVDLAYYSCIVQGIYNLVYIQILCLLSCRMREKAREEWKAKKSLFTHGDTRELNYLLGTVISHLEKSPLYRPDSDYGDMDNQFPSSPSLSRSSSQNQFGCDETDDSVELEVQELLLPFMRIAALLRHHIYEQELPSIMCPEEEFSLLGQFLGLGAPGRPEPISQDGIKGHDFLHWISPIPFNAIWTWVEDLSHFIGRSQVSARNLIETQHLLWGQPQLLQLPHAYEAIFQYYHRKPCSQCNLVPKDPSVCLTCGILVCMRDTCCKHQTTNICEATQHSVDCGAGTAMFLSVNSSTIVVIRGKRACLWGSVYLDLFGEEDRELKRGKPLYLSKERYGLLQQQWLSHRFDHTTRKWVFHRDSL